MKRLAIVACAAAAVSVLALAPAAQASGSGNPYQDVQVGVGYTVYQPTYTAGLKATSVLGKDPDAGFTGDMNLLAQFGRKGGKGFTIQEGNPMSNDIGVGTLVSTTTVMGRKAKVYAYCDPSSTATCTLADVAKSGGHLDVMLPAAKGLHQTRVWIETLRTRAISGAQLISIAKGLKQLPQ